ncbi:hypothetical protein, partial [Streptomyces lushanensis]|uniref:hypothetical protein n=1 Tax=Streptomyces lushanensis TaxID=1434255 RepID=UPI003CCBC7E0
MLNDTKNVYLCPIVAEVTFFDHRRGNSRTTCSCELFATGFYCRTACPPPHPPTRSLARSTSRKRSPLMHVPDGFIDVPVSVAAG